MQATTLCQVKPHVLTPLTKDSKSFDKVKINKYLSQEGICPLITNKETAKWLVLSVLAPYPSIWDLESHMLPVSLSWGSPANLSRKQLKEQKEGAGCPSGQEVCG